MSEEVTHTPTPWTADGNGIHKGIECVAITQAYDRERRFADAEFITRCCNAHHDLLSQVRLFAEIARIESPNTELGGWDWKGMHERLTALLAKVAGK